MVVGPLWCYVSHVFVHIVEETSGGNDEVRRSDEPLTDWLWQGVYVASFVLLWGALGFLAGEIVSHKVRHEWRHFALAGTVGAVLWLMFPVSFLSSASSEIRWTPFSPGLIVRMLRRMVDTTVYFALTAVLVAVCAPLCVLIASDGRVVTMFVGPIVLGLGVIMYARLTGRIAYIARLADAPKTKKKRAKPKRVRGTKTTDPWEVRDEDEPGGFTQPSAMPTITGALEEEISGYDVNLGHSSDAEASPPKSESETRTMAADADERVMRSPARERRMRAGSEVIPDRLELKRLTREEEKRHRHPWIEGIWLFPFQPLAATQWLILSVEFMFVGLLARGLIVLWPSGGESTN